MVNYKLLFSFLAPFAALVLLLCAGNGAFAMSPDGVIPIDIPQENAADKTQADEPDKNAAGKKTGTVVVKPGSHDTLETYLFKEGGFIADSLQVYGKIVAAPAPGFDRLLFGKNDYVYVEISQEYADQYTNYFIVEIGDKVSHPKTGDTLGKLITIIGQLRLIGQEAGYRKGIITESSKEILFNQPIIPAYVFQRPVDSGTLKPRIDGLVVKVLPLHLLGAQYQILYVDKGTDDGLKPGDMFTVMSTTKPISPIGKIKILASQKNTSTAYVIEARTTISVGDTF
ncbi:MAG: hypothetical protein HQK99_05340 [Nitrospirae bacterium]|nr:hypothetical protein [Nitrospirota bacterium]